MAVRFSDDQVRQATQAQGGRVGARASYAEVSTDSRQVTQGCLFVALKGERFDAHDFLSAAVEAGAAGLVVERGRAAAIDAPQVAIFEVKDTLQALGGLARFHRQRFKVPVGAVTGSNGKTTTKELVASILGVRGPALKTEGNLNNEVGVPLTLFRLEPSHRAAVIEMGMNQPQGDPPPHRHRPARRRAHHRGTARSPRGVGFASRGVAKAKAELFWGLGPSGTAVVNLDDARVAGEARGLASRIVTFGRAPTADVRLEQVLSRGVSGLELRLVYRGAPYEVRLRLLGEHNATNATGAFALALAWGTPPPSAREASRWPRPAHRRLELKEGPGASPSSTTATTPTRRRWLRRSRPSPSLRRVVRRWRCWATCSNWATKRPQPIARWARPLAPVPRGRPSSGLGRSLPSSAPRCSSATRRRTSMILWR